MKKPIRILHVLGSLNVGGAETLVMNIYRNIDRNKFQFDFIVHDNKTGFFENEVESLGGKIYRVPKFKGTNIKQYVDVWEELLKSDLSSNIIHSHVRSTASIFLKIAKKNGYSTLIHSHSTSIEKNLSGFVKSMLQNRITKNADILLSCSQEAGIWLFGNKAKFIVLPNCIDTEIFKFNPIRRETKRRDLLLTDEIALVMVGRFEKVKNHLFLIEVFSKVLQINSNYKLYLAGDGSEYDHITNIISEKNIRDSVILLGMKNDIYNLLPAMDLLVLPSKYEGLPLTLIEAQASGISIQASTTVSEECDITNSIEFVPVDDVEAWVKAITSVSINNDDKRILMNDLVTNTEYNVKIASAILLEIYSDLENLGHQHG